MVFYQPYAILALLRPEKYVKDIVCPDGCVMFRLKTEKLDGNNPFIANLFNAE